MTVSKTNNPKKATDLWQAACDRLSPDLKGCLMATASGTAAGALGQLDVLRTLLDEAERKSKLCLQKRWRLRLKNGKTIILRDVVDKIIIWVNEFKAIGDIAVQYDTGAASLPWTGVRFLLHVGKTYVDVDWRFTLNHIAGCGVRASLLRVDRSWTRISLLHDSSICSR